MSIDILIDKIKKTNNPSVAGLDTKLEFIPGHIVDAAIEKHGKTAKAAAEAVLDFNKRLIDALADIVPAVKLQSACYELYGYNGIRVLADTVLYAQDAGLHVTVDVKRGDIGTTAEAYAAATLGEFEIGGEKIRAVGADAVTVNPYLGTDSILPFAELCKKLDKMIFVLAKTSNPSSGEIQDLLYDGRPIYRHVGELISKWGSDSVGGYGYSRVGAVVGATYPAQLEELRTLLPNTFFLVPGYGAQGGGAAGLKPAFDRRGLGAIVNSSRAIMCAWQKDGGDLALSARAEAVRMRDEITGVCL